MRGHGIGQGYSVLRYATVKCQKFIHAQICQSRLKFYASAKTGSYCKCTCKKRKKERKISTGFENIINVINAVIFSLNI